MYNQTGHLFTFHKHFNYCFEYRDTVSYREFVIFWQQYTILFFSHIAHTCRIELGGADTNSELFKFGVK